jgi:hypothetical protein
MNPLTELTPAQLRRAADIQERIQSLQRELNNILGNAAPAPVAGKGRSRKGRKLSPQAIANIRAGVAKRMAAMGKAGKPSPRKGKKKISAAGKARLSALARARWAAVKAAGKSKL